MNRRKFFYTLKAAFLLIFSFAGATFAPAAEKEQWTSVSTENFYLVGNAPEADVRGVALKLEQFRAVFRQLYPQINFTAPVPTKVIVFRDAASYTPYKPLRDDGKPDAAVAGYFLSDEDVNYITLSIDPADADEAFQSIFHEYTHFLVNNNIGDANVPPWFNEGLAEFYMTLKIEGEQNVTIGGQPYGYAALLAKSKLIPADVYFKTDNYTLNQQDDETSQIFYAQSWALMHYLLGSGAASDKQISAFLAAVMNGTPAPLAFKESFLVDYETMEKELKKYIERGSFAAAKVSLKNKLGVNAAMKTAPVSEAEAKTFLADLLCRLNRVDEAEALLKQVFTLNPNLSAAHVALGLVKMRQKKSDEAEKLLEKAVRLDPNSYSAHFRYASALSDKGMSEFGFVSEYPLALAEKMRASLEKAIAVNPNFAPSYELYGFVSSVRNEKLDEAIAYLNRALKIAPGNQRYMIRMAELAMWKHDFATARRLAERVVKNAPDPRLKVYAENTLERIINYEAQMERVKNPSLRRSEITDRIFTEEELRVLRERGLIESLNMQIAKPLRGEQRVLGYVTRIDCRNDSVFYTIKADNDTFKLQSDSFQTVNMVAYTKDMGNAKFQCGEIKQPALAVIVFRLSPDHALGTFSELKSIEFVPPNFKFL